jgi:hypothetical protein
MTDTRILSRRAFAASLSAAAIGPALVTSAAAQWVNPALREAAVGYMNPYEREYIYPGSIIVFEGDFTGDGLRDAIVFAYFRPPGTPRDGVSVMLLANSGYGYELIDRPDVLGSRPRNVRFSRGRVSAVTSMPDGARTWVVTVPGFGRR